MKRILIFALLLILGFSICGNVYAQIDVTIGNGTATNGSIDPPTPYGTYWENFRQQYLVLASEIVAAEGAPGNINSVGFNVQNLHACLPMQSFTIRLKHTTQTSLSSNFELGDYQTVFEQDSFMPVVGWNVHNFIAPFVWNGSSNILVDVMTSRVPYSQNASVFYSTTTFNSSLRFQSDTTEASTATSGDFSAKRANVRFNMQAQAATNPPNPAMNVSPIDAAVNVGTSSALNWGSGGGAPTGYKVHFGTANPPPFIQNTSGTSYAPTLALSTQYYWKIIPFNALGDAANCPVWSFTTAGQPILMTNGQQSVPDGVNYSFYDSGGPTGQYQNLENYTFTFTAANPDSIIRAQFTELSLPPRTVEAVQASPSLVNVTWMEPGTASGEWIHYASGDAINAVGTGAAIDFDVAIRFPASALSNFAGMSLYAVNAWPMQPGDFSVRVWRGGTATAPGPMVIDQPFTLGPLGAYQTVVLNTPVPITGTEELWFGYRCNVGGGYPAGADAGPAIDGFGNMMYYQGAWLTLLNLAPSLNYNWNIQGYAGYSAPTQAAVITPIVLKSAYPGQNEINDRALAGYKVWRLEQGQESNQTAWTQLTPSPITATGWQDTGWGSMPDGTYRWSVKAIYASGVESIASFSNPLPKITQIGTITGVVLNHQHASIAGATVTCGAVIATTNSSGRYTMQVQAGTHSVTASAATYSPATQTGVIVVTGQTTIVNFQLAPIQELLVDGFESYPNFSIDFAPWTLVDVDQSVTFGMTNIAWDNAYEAQAFIIMNPSATVPPISNAGATPHGGDKYAACFASEIAPNNDWMITPVQTDPYEIRFWAKSFTADFGLERMKVGVSTTGTYPASFTIISGANYIQVPDVWTEYSYILSNYPGYVYVGIQCVSNDAFFLMVDDVRVTGITANEDPNVPVVATELHGNFPNPFNPETTIRYSVKEGSPVTIEIYNVKGQIVKTLVNENKASGNYSIVWSGLDNKNQPVSSGVYFYKMNAGKYTSTKKMILMK